MAQLQNGQKAPDFTLPTDNGDVTLSDLLEQSESGVVLYFYPRAMTPGCTIEADDFESARDAFENAGYTILGVSPDSLERLSRFRTKEALGFLLASDVDHAVLEEYGAWGEKTSFGKTTVGVIRSTLVIDKDGTVRMAKYEVKAKGHVQRIGKELGLNISVAPGVE
ncbi:MAG: peroxiredoxin [Actinomycetaceae bacterium]|nr:peroxiredoxin [Actinomycetaceae bacterium]MDY6083336.1 peroxiredoxin [Actinomycetaceae bacterium]